jgi:hypothetical protein
MMLAVVRYFIPASFAALPRYSHQIKPVEFFIQTVVIILRYLVISDQLISVPVR